jgi:hypothetical protein
MSSKAAEMALTKERFQAVKPGTHQKKAYTGTAGTIDNAISSGVSIVRIVCTSAAYVAFGTAPTATTNDIYVPANTPEYFAVPDNGTWKVSAIQDSAGGTLHVTEGATS